MTEKFQPLHTYMKGKMTYPWKTLKEWPYKEKPNYRQRQPNEIIIETDYPSKETNLTTMRHTSKKLHEQGIKHSLWDSGGKGYHLHVLFDCPLNKRQIQEWVKLVFKKELSKDFDQANWSEKRLIGMENCPHRKTWKNKTLLHNYEGGKSNEFPKKITEFISGEEERIRTALKQNPPKPFKGTCPLLQSFCEKPFPEGERHTIIIPNLVAVIPPEQWEHAITHQPGLKMVEIQGWAKEKRTFNCTQLQKYAKKYGLNSCDHCIHQKEQIKQKTWDKLKLIKNGWGKQ